MLNIFVSHSWRNKTDAQLVADAFKGTADVWLDIARLHAGQAIQPTIDAAIKEMDLVILLWSKEAAASAGVAAEIATARRLGVRILPCLLDQTPLDAHPALAGLLGIDFTDRQMGLFRVQIASVQLAAGKHGVIDAAALNDLKDYDGSLAYLNDYRNRQGISGEDSAFWALKALENTNKSFESLRASRDKLGDLLQFMQSAMARTEEAGNDRAKLEAVLDELKSDPRRDDQVVRQLITFIEGKLSTLAPASPEPVEAPADELGRACAVLTERLSAASRESLGALRGRLAPFVQPPLLDQLLGALEHYLVSTPQSVREFAAAVSGSPSPALRQLARELAAYLFSPDDLLHDDQHGLLGFLDDAWLTHNLIYRCAEAGLVRAQDFSANWELIVAGDQVALHLLPPQVKAALERALAQSLRTLADEVNSYQPSFAPDPSARGDRDYHPFMGGGAAVGGAGGGWERQTIDDYFITVGDKVVYNG